MGNKMKSTYFKFYNVDKSVMEQFKIELKELNNSIKRIVIDTIGLDCYKVLAYINSDDIHELQNNDEVLKLYQKFAGVHGEYIPPMPKGMACINYIKRQYN